MRYIPIHNIHPGMLLGKTIFNSNGTKLLNQGSLITSEHLERITALGYPGLYIDDELSKELTLNTELIDTIKIEAVQSLKNLFISPSADSASYQDEINFLSSSLTKIIDEITLNSDVIANMVDLKIYDDYTYFHSINVSILALIIGNSLRLQKKTLIQLGMAAMLHDIGKKFTPIEILSKPGKLTDEEFTIIKEHPYNGYQFIKDNFPTISATAYVGILQHHERYDGSGYPCGTKAQDISLFGRILAVCDVYDALVSERPYHKPHLPSEALEFIQGGSGTMFDPAIVLAFSYKIASYPLGTAVELSNGEIGIVVKNYEEFNTRPKVKIIKNNVVSHYIDLKSDYDARNITIVGITTI
ncbi:HD-GYP domain-containing protein [Konateibacter massiliensis]|uniref:HD-GYP domain-containing protein n=1 Tax=Konateibacter massiliensis TaxID=2002841 RepID=UPI000C148194|nr:HD-GYP domain-containing protein [Konateibacter massiliensis]